MLTILLLSCKVPLMKILTLTILAASFAFSMNANAQSHEYVPTQIRNARHVCETAKDQLESITGKLKNVLDDGNYEASRKLSDEKSKAEKLVAVACDYATQLDNQFILKKETLLNIATWLYWNHKVLLDFAFIPANGDAYHIQLHYGENLSIEKYSNLDQEFLKTWLEAVETGACRHESNYYLKNKTNLVFEYQGENFTCFFGTFVPN